MQSPGSTRVPCTLLVIAISGFVASSVAAQDESRIDQRESALAGDGQCGRCHDRSGVYPVLAIDQTYHSRAAHAAQLACTGCHGASARHADKPAGVNARPKPDRVFGKQATRATASDRARGCLDCHGNDRQLAFWTSGRHKKNDLACDSCHVIHAPKNGSLRQDTPSIAGLSVIGRQLEYETCTQCHKQVRAQSFKTSHHPLIEGKITCSNCHNAHGALHHAMLKDESVNQLCTHCHADKRGPFLREHAPVEENCLACHQPHGSAHAKLLTEKVPNLCQDCHDWSRHPGAYYSGNQGFGGTAPGAPNTRLVGRSCLNCHGQIHGTNAPAARGEFIVR